MKGIVSSYEFLGSAASLVAVNFVNRHREHRSRGDIWKRTLGGATLMGIDLNNKLINNCSFLYRMKITTSQGLDTKQEIFILGLWEEDKHNYKSFSNDLAKELAAATKKKTFSKKFGEKHGTKIKGKNVYVYGLGKKKEFTIEHLRKIMGKAIRCVKAKSATSFATNILTLVKFDAEQLGRAAAEALILADYKFIKYLGKEKKERQRDIENVSLQWKSSSSKLESGLKAGKIIAEATNFTRDLVNEPASVCDSVYLEKVARKLHPKVKVNVLNLAQMKKLGMGSLLGVNAGSNRR